MLHLNARHYSIRIISTQAEQPHPPDDAPGWELIDWRPVPVPGPGGGLALLTACVWAHPICCECGELIRGRAGSFAADGGIICDACIQMECGPLSAAQLCPVCLDALGSPIDRDLAPFCSLGCQQCDREHGREQAQAMARRTRGQFCSNCEHLDDTMARRTCNMSGNATELRDTCRNWVAAPDPPPESKP